MDVAGDLHQLGGRQLAQIAHDGLKDGSHEASLHACCTFFNHDARRVCPLLILQGRFQHVMKRLQLGARLLIAIEIGRDQALGLGVGDLIHLREALDDEDD